MTGRSGDWNLENDAKLKNNVDQDNKQDAMQETIKSEAWTPQGPRIIENVTPRKMENVSSVVHSGAESWTPRSPEWWKTWNNICSTRRHRIMENVSFGAHKASQKERAWSTHVELPEARISVMIKM